MTNLDPDVLHRVVLRLRELEPTSIAIVLKGSYARAAARPDSDLDIHTITRGDPVEDYRTWFDGALHVSAGAMSLDDWVEYASEPADWAMGFPAIDAARYVWTTREVTDRLGDDPTMHHPPGEAEVEDFVEATLKTKHAAARGDTIGIRWHARDAAIRVPGMLAQFNERRVVYDRRDALDAAMSLRVAPPHYADDWPVAAGVADGDVLGAALRLARKVLAFLRERADQVNAQAWTSRYLADGTFERHLG